MYRRGERLIPRVLKGWLHSILADRVGTVRSCHHDPAASSSTHQLGGVKYCFISFILPDHNRGSRNPVCLRCSSNDAPNCPASNRSSRLALITYPRMIRAHAQQRIASGR